MKECFAISGKKQMVLMTASSWVRQFGNRSVGESLNG
jgi:hypothetical protein